MSKEGNGNVKQVPSANTEEQIAFKKVPRATQIRIAGRKAYMLDGDKYSHVYVIYDPEGNPKYIHTVGPVRVELIPLVDENNNKYLPLVDKSDGTGNNFVHVLI